MTTTHSPLAPSSAARWVVCPGSVCMERDYPEEPSDDSRNGDAAHWALAESLRGDMTAEGQIAPNGVILTAEHLEAVDVAAFDVIPNVPRAELAIEQPVTIPRVHAQCYGTPDVACWTHGARPTLHVLDFKYGHRFVPAVENWQLMAYASGLLSATKYTDEQVDVALTVIQPRCYAGPPVRTWTIPATDLRGYVNRMAMAAEEAMSPNPTLTPNPECRDCRARHACPALQKDAYRSAATSEAAIPFNLPTAAASLEYKMLSEAAERLKARLSGLEVQLTTAARTGAVLPWQRLETTAGREAWRDGMEPQVLALGAALGVPLGRAVEPITPNQARKAGVPADVVAMYAHRPGGATKLVPDDGQRAARVFQS